MSHIDLDLWAGNSLGHQRDTAAGPLAAALRYDSMAITAQSRTTLPARSYEPLLSIAPADDLGDETWIIEMTDITGGASTPLDPVVFGPYSEKDGFVPCLAPPVGPDKLLPAAMLLRLRVRRDGVLVPVAQTRNLLAVRYAEGRIAKLLAITQSETLRTRRLMREIAARRQLEQAKGFMLDRLGRELAVPRFDSDVQVRGGELRIRQARESDDTYRNRLGIYRPYLVPTRKSVEDRLNGPGSPLQVAGAPARFAIREDDNPFQIGFKVFGVGATAAEGDTIRANYLQYLRDTTLIDPTRGVPTNRQLPSIERRRETQMRRRLRDRLQFSAGAGRSMAPWLARAFDRATRTLDHLGVSGSLRIAGAQNDAGGSRFELGLAAEFRGFSASQRNAIRAAINGGPASTNDVEVAGILANLAEADMSDNSFDWFFDACGFRSATPMTGGNMLLSHVSMGHLQISGPDGLDRGSARMGQAFSANLRPTGSAIDAALANAIAGGSAGWPAGIDDWDVVPSGQMSTVINGLVDPALPAQRELDAMGLGLPPDIARFRQSLNRVRLHQLRLLRVRPGLRAALSANGSGPANRLGEIADTLGSNGAASLLLLRDGGGQLVLAVSSIGMPQVGTNIGPRRSSDFFWAGTTIAGGEVRLQGQGSQTFMRALGDGLYAVSTLAYSRIGATDPFEYRVTLPTDARIDYDQYEILMNALGRMYPVGVEINTWDIRRKNVALDGVNQAPLSPKLSRSFRPFLRRRFQGSGDAPQQN